MAAPGHRARPRPSARRRIGRTPCGRRWRRDSADRRRWARGRALGAPRRRPARVSRSSRRSDPAPGYRYRSAGNASRCLSGARTERAAPRAAPRSRGGAVVPREQARAWALPRRRRCWSPRQAQQAPRALLPRQLSTAQDVAPQERSGDSRNPGRISNRPGFPGRSGCSSRRRGLFCRSHLILPYEPATLPDPAPYGNNTTSARADRAPR